MSKSILIVDEERHIRTLLEHTLSLFEEEDVTIRLAASGQEALEECRRSPPDLVFVDARLSDIHGKRFCDSLRLDPGARHTQIILMVDKGWEVDVHHEAGGSITHVIVKPFDPEALRLLTGRLLGIDVEP